MQHVLYENIDHLLPMYKFSNIKGAPEYQFFSKFNTISSFPPKADFQTSQHVPEFEMFIIKLKQILIFFVPYTQASFWGCSKIKFDNKLSMNVHLMYNFYMLFIDYLIYLYASILIRYGIQLHAIPKYIETKSETANT